MRLQFLVWHQEIRWQEQAQLVIQTASRLQKRGEPSYSPGTSIYEGGILISNTIYGTNNTSILTLTQGSMLPARAVSAQGSEDVPYPGICVAGSVLLISSGYWEMCRHVR